MQTMKWITILFTASMLFAGSALTADPVAPAVGNEQADHSANARHAGKTPDAAAPVAGKEEQTDHTDHTSHGGHDMKCCMEMGGKKCMKMGDKKCMEMGGKKCMAMDGKGCDCKDCMHGDGKQCGPRKGKKNLHKPCDACDTKKDAAKSGEKKPAEEKSDSKGDTAKLVLSETEGRALAQKSNCFSCHSIDKKVVGPAWKDVAAKYRGDTSAEDKLIAKVSKGGSGVWGSVPMPANSPAVKDADIKALVKFLLSLK